MPTFTSSPEFCASEAVTVVIPAYNEASRIHAVLDTVCAVAKVAQIIVIDDASTDGTATVVGEYGQTDNRVRLLRHSVNRGKAVAMLVGATASVNDLIVFVDADLIGLHPQNIEDVITPVQGGLSAMALGIFTECRHQTDWSHQVMPFLSGQRCLRWHLFRTTPAIYTAGWSIEVALSLHAWRRHYPVTLVQWPGVTHITRPEKMSRLRGHLSNLGMWSDIAQYVGGQLCTETKRILWPYKRRFIQASQPPVRNPVADRQNPLKLG